MNKSADLGSYQSIKPGDLLREINSKYMLSFAYIIINYNELNEDFFIEKIEKEAEIIEPIDLLPADDARYLLVNKDNELIHVLWIPNLADVERKNTFSSNRASIALIFTEHAKLHTHQEIGNKAVLSSILGQDTSLENDQDSKVESC